MRTLVHLSDLHFGAIQENLLAPLREAVAQINPDLLVVSGDLTQRARPSQFRDARVFLDSLPWRRIVVPGNHDIPLDRPLARFLAPLAMYRRYITDDVEPYNVDNEIAILGLNSARSFTIQHGRLNARQVDRLARTFREVGPSVVKILVSHHPFDLPVGCHKRRAVRGAVDVLAAMAACQGDVVLSGHLHQAGAACCATEADRARWSVLFVQAGTAISSRQRGAEPSFNVLRVSRNRIDVEQHRWSGIKAAAKESVFELASSGTFTRGPSGWSARAP